MATKKKTDGILDVLADKMDMAQTHNPLMAALRDNDKKNLFKTNVTTAYIKTGFHLFDYYFGSVINIHDDLGHLVRQEARVGQAAGTFNLIIGNTGSGKTTLACQIAGNILRQYPNANVIHYDCEERFDLSRAEIITRLPASYFDPDSPNHRYVLKSGQIGLDLIQEMVVKLYAKKMEIKDLITVHTGFKDEFNKEICILEPTVIIIDSIATVLNTTFSPDNQKDVNDAGQMRTNMDGARDAKTFKGFLRDILPLCKEANIIIYGINHINDAVATNPYAMPTKQQNYLKQGEIIPGGRTMVYLPHNIIKLTAKPADDFTEESDGFAGLMVMVEPIKTSANQSGNNSKGISFEMVFSHRNGFDPLRTLVMYGRKEGIIEGNRTRLKFKEDDSYTFNFKDIYKEKNEKPIWDDINKYIVPGLNKHLSFIEPDEVEFDDRSMAY